MADIDVGRLTAAARALMLAGRWTQAAGLLEDVTAANPAERAVLAVAQAEVAVNQDFWTRTNSGSPALARACAAVADAGAGSLVAFDLEFHRLTHDYADELFGADGDVPGFGPPGRAPEVIEGLAARAASLRASAPDQGRAAAATFYAGLIEDNLRGDGEAARSMFAAALKAAEEARDDLTTSDALRHLGYHLSEAGDAGQARQMWERSAEQRQRAGAVPYVLSQQLLLAGLARDTGDPDTARTVAREVGRWAHALGVTILESQAAEIAGAPGSAGS
jgi:tetratricopeptide (TPR) repeat protein